MDERAQDILAEALKFNDPAERHAWLESASGGDEALRAEVESLLTALNQAGDFSRSEDLKAVSRP